MSEGKVLEAVQFIEKQFPNLLSTNTEIAFKLQSQIFIEFIRQRKAKEALECAQEQVLC